MTAFLSPVLLNPVMELSKAPRPEELGGGEEVAAGGGGGGGAAAVGGGGGGGDCFDHHNDQAKAINQ